LFPKIANTEERRAAERAEAEAARQLAHARGETNAVRLPNEGLSTGKILQATIDKIASSRRTYAATIWMSAPATASSLIA
jgi:regulator of protease activity HflC (stomatin/prohibitin superfamily)